MFKSPLVVGIRQFANWEEAGSVDATLYGLGQNTGNMMFTQALLTVLDGARWGSFGITPADLEGRDVIVIACANWINGFDDFGWLADRLERTSLPIVLVGIGAQSSLEMDMPKVTPGTLRFLSLVKDRSTSISARGDFTCEVLEQLGINNAVATGCPSLLLAGRDGPSIAIPESISCATTCVQATRHGVQPAAPFDAQLYRLAFREKMDIVLQSETPDIYCALGKPAPAGKEEQFAEVLKQSYGSNDLDAISAYLRQHGRAFSNVASWLAYMKTKHFCFGARIHGTVASLISGTPATLIAHDSRTLEMARAMSIPYVLQSEVGSFDDFGNKLLLRNDILRLATNYRHYFDAFSFYFSSNNLAFADCYKRRECA